MEMCEQLGGLQTSSYLELIRYSIMSCKFGIHSSHGVSNLGLPTKSAILENVLGFVRVIDLVMGVLKTRMPEILGLQTLMMPMVFHNYHKLLCTSHSNGNGNGNQ